MALTTNKNLPSRGSLHRPCIALFPGAFRPPHKGHLQTVTTLCEDARIDEVIIIISGRMRSIPDSNQALGPQTALDIWKIYLESSFYDKVKVQIAESTAIKCALAYFDKLDCQHELLFCIGESDFERGDDRFNTIDEHARQSGISAQLFVSQTGSCTIRSSDVRKSLTQSEIVQAKASHWIPRLIPAPQRRRILQLCEEGKIDLAQGATEELQRILQLHGWQGIKKISIAGKNQVEPTLRVDMIDGTRYFAKHTADSVHAQSGKAVNRIAIEKRALSRLRTLCGTTLTLPQIILYDKACRLLLVSDIGRKADCFESCFKRGDFSDKAVSSMIAILQYNHQATNIKPIRGSLSQDKYHWHKQLMALCTDCNVLLNKDQSTVLYLRHFNESRVAARACFLFLNATAPHLYHLPSGGIGRINFEHCAAYGDPAYELGEFIATILHFGSMFNHWHSALSVLGALDQYRYAGEESMHEFNARTVRFGALHLMRMLSLNALPNVSLKNREMLRWSRNLFFSQSAPSATIATRIKIC